MLPIPSDNARASDPRFRLVLRIYRSNNDRSRGYLENSVAWKTADRDSLCSFARPIGFRLIMTIRARMATLVWEKMSLIFH